MDELIAFVRRCLDEDERLVAKYERYMTKYERYMTEQARAAGTFAFVMPPGWGQGEPFEPGRVLAKVKADRRILELHKPMDDAGDDPFVGCDVCSWRDDWERLHVEFPCDTIRLLAQPYAGRDGWREEWQMDG